MNYLIHQLLNAEEINSIKKELEKCSQLDWEDGKKTAGSHASMVKNWEMGDKKKFTSDIWAQERS